MNSILSKLDKQANRKARAAAGARTDAIRLHIQASHKTTQLKAQTYMLRVRRSPVQALRLLLQSLWVHMRFAQMCKRALYSWCPLVPSVSHTDSASSSWGFWAGDHFCFPVFWGEAFDNIVSFRSVCSNTPHVLYPFLYCWTHREDMKITLFLPRHYGLSAKITVLIRSPVCYLSFNTMALPNSLVRESYYAAQSWLTYLYPSVGLSSVWFYVVMSVFSKALVSV